MILIKLDDFQLELLLKADASRWTYNGLFWKHMALYTPYVSDIYYTYFFDLGKQYTNAPQCSQDQPR